MIAKTSGAKGFSGKYEMTQNMAKMANKFPWRFKSPQNGQPGENRQAWKGQQLRSPGDVCPVGSNVAQGAISAY